MTQNSPAIVRLLLCELLAITVAIAVALVTPGTAVAGTFDVISCSSTNTGLPLLGADDAWRYETSDRHAPPHVEQFRRCSVDLSADHDGAYNAHADGLAVWTAVDVPDDPGPGVHGQWTFRAAPGTSIARIRIAGEAGKQLDSWELFTRLADGTKLPGSDCDKPPRNFECTVGGPGAPFHDWELAALRLPPTTQVRVGIACAGTTRCGLGALLREAWNSIYSSRITITDDTLPTTGAVTGPLVTDGWKRGTVPVTVAGATDNVGILALRATASHEPLATADLPCDFTRARPCADAGTTTLQADTRRLPDGVHLLEVQALDAARNVAVAVRRELRIDNTAPAAPVPASATTLAADGDLTAVRWTTPEGQAAPVTTAHWSACGPAGCTAGTAHTSVLGGSVAVPTASPGVHVVRVALADAAGNHDPARTTTWTITRTTAPGPSPPGARPGAPATSEPARLRTTTPATRLTARPTVAADRRTVTVRGRVSNAATRTVRVTVSARVARERRTVTRTVRVSRGRFTARVRLPGRAWRAATITVREPGTHARALRASVRNHA